MPESTLTFRHAVDVLLKRWKLKILLAVAAAIAAAVASQSLPDNYRSESQLLVHNSMMASKTFGPNPNVLTLDTFLDFFKNRTIAQRIIDRYQLQTTPEALLDSVTVKQLRGKDILNVSYSHADPEMAQKILGALIDGATEILMETYQRGEASARAANLHREVMAASREVNLRRSVLEEARRRHGYDEYLNQVNFYSSIIAEYERELSSSRSALAGYLARRETLAAYLADQPRFLTLKRQVSEYPEFSEPLRTALSPEGQKLLATLQFTAETPNEVYENLKTQEAGNELLIMDAQARIDEASRQLPVYGKLLVEARKARDMGKMAVDHAEFQYSTARDAYTNLMQQYQSVGAIVTVESQLLQVIDSPTRPWEPDRPSPMVVMILAGFIVFVIATFVSMAIDAYYL